jgi:hypothetical protein
MTPALIVIANSAVAGFSGLSTRAACLRFRGTAKL